MRALRCRAWYKLQKSGNLRARSDAGLKQRFPASVGTPLMDRARTQLAVCPTLHRPEKNVRFLGSAHPRCRELVLNSEGVLLRGQRKVNCKTADPLSARLSRLLQEFSALSLWNRMPNHGSHSSRFGDQVHHDPADRPYSAENWFVISRKFLNDF